jgi:hypothetical protein
MSKPICVPTPIRALLLCGALALGAGALTAARASDEDQRHGGGSGVRTELIQSGQRLVLLGVTSDNHALVQDGSTVYATALRPGAPKHRIGSSPPGVVSFVYTVGEVAFVWTAPNRTLPGFGVSPLHVWSAATGAHKASDNSAIGTFTTSASANGRHVMYTTRSPADGSVGDIEFARTDLSERKTLAAGVPMSFPGGACRPWGSFVGQAHRSHPVALFCEGGAATATLARWSRYGDTRSTLLAGVLTQPFFTTSPDGRQFFTALADRTPVVVNDEGQVRRLEEGVLSRRGFFTTNRDVFYTARAGLAGLAEMRRAQLPSGNVSFVSDQLFSYVSFQFGSDLIVTPPSSPDGSKLAFITGVDPATGLFDLRLADLVNSGSTAVETDKRLFLSGPVFSTDSEHTLYARVDDPATGAAQLVAAGPKGKRAIGAPSLVGHDRLKGARIAFNDNPVVDPADSFSSTADLKVVDLSQPVPTPTLVAAQAYQTFLPARRGRVVVFSTARGHQGPGLYVAKGRGHGLDD